MSPPALWLALGLALGLVGAATPAGADDEDAALCEQAIVNGARRGGVPPEVLHAVALTETGRSSNGRMRPYPWAINRGVVPRAALVQASKTKGFSRRCAASAGFEVIGSVC